MFVGGYPYNCDNYQEVTNPDNACSVLMIMNQDEGHERIDMRKLKSVEFLPAPKKDKAGNGMFDTWRYSPFTGERLSDNEGQSNVQPTSSIPTLSLSGADNPSSRNQLKGFHPV
jgi:hypothetical protein